MTRFPFKRRLGYGNAMVMIALYVVWEFSPKISSKLSLKLLLNFSRLSSLLTSYNKNKTYLKSQKKYIKAGADAVIVGSANVKIMENTPVNKIESKIMAFTKKLKNGTKQ